MSEAWSGDRPRRLVGLLVGAAYVVLLAVPFLQDYPPDQALPWIVAAAIVGVLLLGTAVYSFVKARDRRTGLLEAAPTLILLLAPVPYLVGIPPEWGLVFVLVAFLLKIRDLARGHAMVFSLIAILGILVITSVFLADVEEEAGEGNMKTFPQALWWGLGQIFRFHRSVSFYAPKTETGNIIGIAVVLSGVLFSAVLLSALTSWAVNSSRSRKDAKSNDALIAKAVDAAVLRAVGATMGPEAAEAFARASVPDPERGPPTQGDEVRVWIDADRVVGTRPRGWWESRRQSIPAFVDSLRERGAPGVSEITHGKPALLVAVVEGSGRAQPEGESTTADGQRLLVIHAEQTADELIEEQASAPDVVITDEPSLVQAMREAGVAVASPASLSPRARTTPTRDSEDRVTTA